MSKESEYCFIASKNCDTMLIQRLGTCLLKMMFLSRNSGCVSNTSLEFVFLFYICFKIDSLFILNQMVSPSITV